MVHFFGKKSWGRVQLTHGVYCKWEALFFWGRGEDDTLVSQFQASWMDIEHSGSVQTIYFITVFLHW